MAADTPGANGNGGARPSPLKNPVTRLVLLGVAVIAIVVGVIWGLDWRTRGRFMQTTNDAYLHADMVTAAPKVSGYVDTVYVVDNQAVSAGQPLVKVDERTYRAALNQALATVEARKADIVRAQAETDQQLATIAQAKAQLAGSRIAAAFAGRQVGRYRPLAASGADTSERLDQLGDNNDQAQTTVRANTAAVDAAQRQVATLKAAIEQAKAQLQAAQAQARQADLDLSDTLVRSSIDGRVGDKSVRVGQYVQPGTRMMSVVPVRQIYLTANFKETQIGLMRAGQPVAIRLDALPGVKVHGRVESFAPGTGAQFALLPPENATGNFTKIVQRAPVRISVDAGPEVRKVLIPGLSATVTVDTRGARDDLAHERGQ
jgi:membrane fusion protein (multidrug efflux system)